MNLSLLPQPKSLKLKEGTFTIPKSGVIGVPDLTLVDCADEVKELFKNYTTGVSCAGAKDTISLTVDSHYDTEAYRLRIDEDKISVVGGSPLGAFWGVQTLRQILEQSPSRLLHCLVIEDWPDFEDRGLYYDVCRGRVPKLKQLMRLAETLSHYKINQLQLYIEHTFLFRAHPDIGKGASPLTADDILALDAFCRRRHIELVPSLASFGHLAPVLKHPRYHELAEDWGIGKYVGTDMPYDWLARGFTLSPANPKIYDFLDSLFAEFLPLFTSKRFNACCDETVDLGYGQSQALCAKRGKGRVYLDHLVKVNDLAKKYGKKMMFWGDIIRHHPELIPEIPKDVTVLDWGYGYNHPFERIEDFKKVGLEFLACPGTSSWVSLFPRLPEAVENIAGFATAAKRHGAKGLLNTDWGDGGHYNFMEYSWHGYLFGAEQSWNTAAERRSFNQRFADLFLKVDDVDLTDAIEELGEITYLNVAGFYQSVWLHVLFATPDARLFQLPQPVDAHYVKDGKIVAGKLTFDAKYAKGLPPRLEKIRGVLLAASKRKGADPQGILPYWIFAVDTIATAARKYAAFGPGGAAGGTVKAKIKTDLKSLRSRFSKLWLARNRPSEIDITLARYDRAISGESAKAILAAVEPGKVRLSIENTGEVATSGELELMAYAAAPLKIRGEPTLVVKNLKTGDAVSKIFEYSAGKGAAKIKFKTYCANPAIQPAVLTLGG